MDPQDDKQGHAAQGDAELGHDKGRDSQPPLGAGEVLGGKYEVRGVLGEGATGVVYDVQPLGREDAARVALKLIHPHLLGDSQIRGRFLREMAILRRVSGEHLCPILDCGELPDPRTSASLLYMAIPKVEGISLERLMAEGPVPVERAVSVVLQICSALHDAHLQGVVHRDLKPANVLLRGDGHAFVVDFGLAKVVAGPGGTGTTALTSHNMVFGTPEYMAPEQARGDELDARCDVYAAGVILYELLAGRVPFRGTSPLSVLTAHLTEPPPPLEEAAGSPALRAVAFHALAKSPDERYATASDLARAMEHAHRHPDDIDAVSPRLPHDTTAPLRTRSAAPLGEPPVIVGEAQQAGRTRWIVVWTLAIALGIAVGVWLSLRAP